MRQGLKVIWAVLTLTVCSSRVATGQPSLGLALYCDGLDDYVSATVPTLPIANSSYTIEAWINPGSLSAGGIVAWGNYASNQLNALNLTANGIENSWGGAKKLEALTGSIAGEWHHVAATYDGSLWRLYLDGNVVASNTPPAHAIPTSGNFTIGKSDTHFAGHIDEVRIWNVARTAAQIQTNCLTRFSGGETGLIALWRFNEWSGIATFDGTTNRYRGTLNNRVRRAPSFWWPVIVPEGANPLTNVYGATFVDPGARILGSALEVSAGDYHVIALKGDGTIVGWGYGGGGETNPPPSATNVIAISAAGSHNMALKLDGSLVTWGNPSGNGPTNTPPETTNLVAVAAGEYHNLALTAAGNIITWGRTDYGVTMVPADATNVVAIASEYTHNLALRADGTVVGWGYNGQGQVTIPPNATNVISIKAGRNHSMALRGDGTVIVWGQNYSGQTNVPPGVTNIVAIEAGWDYSFAIRADGKVLSWGDYGLTNVPPGSTNFTILAIARYNAFAIRTDGTLTAWGWNDFYLTVIPPSAGTFELPIAVSGMVDVNTFGPYTWTYSVTNRYGVYSITNRLVYVLPPKPTVVTLPATNVSNTIATLKGLVNPAGATTTTWFEWGLNSAYLSNTTPAVVSAGTNSMEVSFPLTGLKPGDIYHYRLAADNSSGIVRGADQTFWSPRVAVTGMNPFTNQCHVTFTNPGASTFANPLSIAANGYWSVALKADRRITAWGNNTYGQTSINVAPQNANVIALDAGKQHGLALRADGTVFCWGNNDYGQTNVPPNATNIIAIAAGYHFNLALRADGAIIGWGYNTYGGATAPASATNVVAISAGGGHSLALRADGTVVAWGDGNTGETLVPDSATNVIAISAGGAHSLALRKDRTVVGWGYDYYDQSTIPPNATNVVAIAAGSLHNAVLRADGTVIAWGDNRLGATNVSTSATNVIAVAAGTDHTLALRADGTVVGWGYGGYGQTATYSPTSVSLPISTNGNLNVNVPGSYTVDYAVSNSLGGIGTAQRTVVVVDTLPPVPTLVGDNPLFLAVGEAFIDPGATATDLCEGNVSASIIASGAVDISTPGQYIRSYTATDAFNNAAAIQRTVMVGLPAAATLPPSVSSDSSVVLNGSANPRGMAATGWFEWGVASTYGNRTPPFVIGSGVLELPVNEKLNGLDRSRVYHYRVVVSNSFGVAIGDDRSIWWPSLRLNGPSPAFHQCHSNFVDSVTVNGSIQAISDARDHSMVLRADGKVIDWGGYNQGQLNPVPSSATNVVAIAAGSDQSIALKADGTVVSWPNAASIPNGLSDIATISTRSSHCLALKRDGALVVWGNNYYGQTNAPANATNLIAVSAGEVHSAGLCADGYVVVWGDNGYGLTNPPPNATNLIAIACGNYHVLGLKADGSVVSWGSSVFGQTNVPPSATNIIAVAGGQFHSLALRADGRVLAWGRNSDNEANPPLSATNVIAISAGGKHSMALRADGTIVAWGDTYYGQSMIPSSANNLGLAININGTVDTNTPGTNVLSYICTNEIGAISITHRTVVVRDTLRPTLTMLGTNPMILSVGDLFAEPGATATDLCAGGLTTNIIISGLVDTSTAGNYTRTYAITDPSGNTTQSNRTVLVGFPQAITLAVSNLADQSVAVNGTVNPRGANTAAWFEWGTSIAYGGGHSPVAVGMGTSNEFVSATVAGLTPGVLHHSRLVASNATGISFGENRMFWLPGLALKGPAFFTNQCHVTYTNPGVQLVGLAAVSGGADFSLMLKADGRLFAWGYGSQQTNVPVSVTNIVAMDCGNYHVLALRRDGTVLGWGRSTYGEASPPTSATNVVAVSAGYYHSLALRADSTMLGWGNSYSGQSAIPASATNGIAIAAGYSHSMLLRKDKSILVWGSNISGQTNVPVAASNAIAVASGDDHCLALRDDGRVVAWGANNYGQTNVPASATNIVAITAGSAHNLALRADGRIVTWGRNNYGQTNVPVSATNIVTIGTGVSHSLAIRADGVVLAWGANTSGQANAPTLSPLNLLIVTNSPVNTNIPGSYSVTYTVTNHFSATATTNRNVVVADTLPPALILAGANPMMLLAGNPFIEPGASALDLCAGNLGGNIIFDGSVDHTTPGSYTLTYAVADAFTNARVTNRTVVVVTLPHLNTYPATNQSFRLQFSNTPGARFNVLAATNLLQPLNTWAVLGPVTEISPGYFQFSDSGITNWAQRFYRVTWP